MNRPIRCLIVDDEYLARELLRTYVEQLPQLELVATCDTAPAGLEVLQTQEVDLVLLDIQMPTLSGLELVRTLTTKPKVIFTTAYAQHALEGFELQATDYLVKPIAFERFVRAVNNARQQLALEWQAGEAGGAPAEASEAPGHLYAKVDHKLVKVAFDDILYIEGLREYVGICTAKRRYVVHQSMKKLEQRLPPQRFMRVHKSYIVALNHIKAVYGNTIELEGKELPIGKRYKDAFLNGLNQV